MYHKIQTVYLRNPDDKFQTLLDGQFAKPEFAYLAGNEWVFTEKIDGTNIRVIWDGEQVKYGGRTDNAQIPTFLYNKLSDILGLDKFAQYEETPMILYGEGYGAKIQKGGGNYIPDGVSFILFDIKVGNNWLERDNVQDIAEHLEIDTVPIIGRGILLDAIELCKKGFQSRLGTQIAEGLVMRPSVELHDRMGHRVISKIKHKDFGNPVK
jgi:ATP-dependent RNA circularization protein (DNA/RNA ligase family)